MRKILFLLLLTVASYGQTTTGKETKFPYGIRNQSVQTITTPTYLNTQGTDGTQGVIPSAYIEKTENKISTIYNYATNLYTSEKAVHDALDLKLNISDLPTNLTLYPTTTTSDVSGYVVMVKDIHDVRYNTTAVDVSTPTITTTGQLISQRISDAGILIGQPGVFNITTFGNIRHLSGSGTATFYFEVYHRDSAGVETLICTSSVSSPVTNGGYNEFTASGVWDDGDFVASDRIVIKSYANRIAGGSDPVYQFQFGGTSPVRTLLPVPFSVVDAGYELKSNKSSSLTPSDDLYPNNNAVLNALPVNYSKIVYVNATSPITATIFDTENPPITNDNLLKNDVANLYIGTDASTWVYNSTTYVTKTVVSNSNFYLAGTTTDAGNTKTGHISRTGNITTTGKLGASGTSYFATNATDKAYVGTSTLNPNNSKFVIKGTVTGGINIESILDNSGNVIFNIDNSGNTLLGSTSSESNFAKLGIKGLGTDDIQAWVNSSGVLKSKINNVGSFISSSDVFASNIIASQFMAISPDKALNGNSGGSLAIFSRNTYWESLGKIKYNADYSSTYDARTLVDKAYTDAKITQTITNGVTDKSPSEDAVYDALANVKRTLVKSTTTGSLITGTISQTILYSQLIPANTFKNGDFFNIEIARIGKTGVVGTLRNTIRINTTNTLTGSIMIADNLGTTNNISIPIQRIFSIEGTNLVGFPASQSASDIVNSSTAIASYAFNPAIDNYIFVCGTLSSALDSMFFSSLKISN